MRTLFLTLLTTLTLLNLSTANAMHDGKNRDHDVTINDTEKSKIQSAADIKKESTNSAVVKINGLVCDFCARAMEKVFAKREEVAGINVDLDAKLVTIKFQKGQTIDDTTIRQLIVDSGYDVIDIKR